MSTLKQSDPQADMILDFVAVMESGGNYNAVIGNARATEDLSTYTLGRIKSELMPHLLSLGRPSTATGRYQIIRATFEALQAQLGLADDVMFTCELQDQMAMRLLATRGYHHWQSGDLSDRGFAHNLSCEWASLPDPMNGGKSHYDGVGPNHAGRTVEEVYEMLAAARAVSSPEALGVTRPTPVSVPVVNDPQGGATPPPDPIATSPTTPGHVIATGALAAPQLAPVVKWAANFPATPMDDAIAMGFAAVLIAGAGLFFHMRKVNAQ